MNDHNSSIVMAFGQKLWFRKREAVGTLRSGISDEGKKATHQVPCCDAWMWIWQWFLQSVHHQTPNCSWVACQLPSTTVVHATAWETVGLDLVLGKFALMVVRIDLVTPYIVLVLKTVWKSLLATVCKPLALIQWGWKLTARQEPLDQIWFALDL